MLTIRDGNSFDWANIPLAECIAGNILDTFYSLSLREKTEKILEETGVLPLIHNILTPLQTCFAEMEFEGMHVNPEYISKLESELELALEKEEETIRELASRFIPTEESEKFNIASNDDLAKLLFMKLDKDGNEGLNENSINMYPPGLTDKGAVQTNAESLDFVRKCMEEELMNKGVIFRGE